LLTIVVILLVILIFLALKRRGVKPEEIEDAMSLSWTKLGMEEKLGRLTAHTEDIRNCPKSLEQMLRVPVERAALGELSMETILSDQLPTDMFGIREMVLDGKIPDAHIRSTAGIVCIDSKFPLENYLRMTETEEAQQKERSRSDFRRDIRTHLNKIAHDYVCPEKGSADFAFAYIPSEAVYYSMIRDEFALLQDHTKRGVQVVSPLTLSHKVQLIKAGVHARKLSEDAERVKKDLFALSREFSEIDKLWQVFYTTHLRNAEGKAEELDTAYKRLRDEFDRISRLAQE